MDDREHYVENLIGWGVEFIESGGPVAVMHNHHAFLIAGEPSAYSYSAPIKVYQNLAAMMAFERCVYRWLDLPDGLFADYEFEVGQWVTPVDWIGARERDEERMRAHSEMLRAKYRTSD